MSAVEPETEALEPRRRPRRWAIAGRVAASVILLAWIFRRTDIGEVWRSLQAANGALLLLAMGLCFVGYALSLTRWSRLLAVQGVRPPTRSLIHSFLVAMFFNNLLPSTIGGDAARAHDSWRWGTSRGGAVAVVFLDRFLGVVALLIFALIASLLWHGVNGRLYMSPLWIALAALGALGLVASLVWLPAERIRSVIRRVRLPGAALVLRVVSHVSDAFEAYRGRKGVLAWALGLSVLVQTTAVLYYYVLAQALGLGVPLLPFFLIVPLSIFTMMLPISINGIGLRENAFAFFFGAFGVLASQSVALAWVDYGFVLLQGLAGGIAYALRKVAPKNMTEESPQNKTETLRRWYEEHAEEYRGAATIEHAFTRMPPEQQARLNRFKLWHLEEGGRCRMADKRVLEFGCGHGRLAVEMPSYAEYVGVDFSAELIEIGRERLSRAGLQDRARLIPGDCMEYEGPAAYFDVVCSLGMFSFVDDAAAVLRKMAYHLRPGGLLFIDGHLSSPLLDPIRRLRSGEPTGGTDRLFRKREIRSLLGGAGLVDPEIVMREYPLLGDLYARHGWNSPLALRNTLARAAIFDALATNFFAFARKPDPERR